MAINNYLKKVMLSDDRREQAIPLYMDMSKAFDTVYHEILLKKLYKYCIRGNSYNLIVLHQEQDASNSGKSIMPQNYSHNYIFITK